MKTSIKSIMAAAITAVASSSSTQASIVPRLTIEGAIQYTAPIGGNLINQDGYAPNGVAQGTPFLITMDFVNLGQDSNASPNTADHFDIHINYTMTIGPHTITGTRPQHVFLYNNRDHYVGPSDPIQSDSFQVFWYLNDPQNPTSPINSASLVVNGDDQYFAGDNLLGVLPNLADNFLLHAENFLATPTIIPGDFSTQQVVVIQLTEGNVVGNINNITYIPAPGAAALMGVGALAAFRRRRGEMAPSGGSQNLSPPANDLA